MKTIDKVTIRNIKPSDYENVLSVIPEWWNGRDLSSSALKIFFVHYMGFAIEQGDGVIEGVPVTLNYLGKNNHKVLFRKDLR